MGSLLGDLPSYNPHNFSQLRPSDPSHRSQLSPLTYHATHDRTVPPADQVISTEVTNILLRQFYHRADQKLRMKRPATDSPTPEHASKHPRSVSSACVEDIEDSNARRRLLNE